MALPQAFIQELHDRTDIVDLIGSYVPLRRRGRLYTGLCPFHNEKTPSFTVYPDTQSYYCFGCGAGGDVISFVRQRENLDYIEAVRFLANRAGMQMPEEADDSGFIRRKRVFEINRLAARFFFKTLNSDEGREARAYLRRRGLQDAYIKKFGIGYAPGGWNGLRDHLRAQGYRDDEAVDAGVCTKSEKGSVYDFFRERVMFPIFDLRGNVIAFSGRTTVGDNRKYLNTRDTPVFKKSRAIFAMNIAKNTDTRRLILCEGQMDVIAIHQAGFDNAIAACGTALTDEQVRIISQYADEVVLAYDGDGAGQKATRRAIDLFKNTSVQLRVLRIEGAKDPDEYIKAFGADKFRALLDGSSNSIEYELRRAKADCDIETDAGRVKYLRGAAAVLARAPSPTERDLYAGRVAQETGVSKESILLQADSVRRQAYARRAREQDERLVRDVGEKYNIRGAGGNRLAAASAGRNLIALLYRSPDLCEAVAGQVDAGDFADEREGRIFSAMSEAIRRDEFTGMGSLAAALDSGDIALLSGILAETGGINYSAQDADFLVERLLRGRQTPSKEQLRDMDAAALQALVEKKKEPQ